ncbi:hypothetical protein Ahy_A04g021344 isoform D [Arachis hypogaea]|uniref:At4g15545-like C-terminal domain-containing protein n=2 Tax=Arachis hypogaea TaxID=3818 RepID=A0A445DK48_ARAHY|nr:hypothetical protein Ahy_A04g021344 isoform D [Arachis hypogaea]
MLVSGGGGGESSVDAAPPEGELPEELVRVLPLDPFEQLDLARKITSIALSTRVHALQSESSNLRAELAEKVTLIAELQSQVDSLNEAADKLAHAEQDKERLVKENASLSNTVRKLSRDVSKLEVFRRRLMQSLQEDEENSGEGGADMVGKLQSQASMTSTTQPGDDDSSSMGPSRTSSMRVVEDGVLILGSEANTPRISPPGSPSARRTSSKPVSPSSRRQAISFSTSQQTGRTRVDGKEFFRQVRSRLSYEQFGAFLSNVKELNSHKQTKEETLQKADEIFGPQNKDLYAIFEGAFSFQTTSLESSPPWCSPSVNSSSLVIPIVVSITEPLPRPSSMIAHTTSLVKNQIWDLFSTSHKQKRSRNKKHTSALRARIVADVPLYGWLFHTHHRNHIHGSGHLPHLYQPGPHLLQDDHDHHLRYSHPDHHHLYHCGPVTTSTTSLTSRHHRCTLLHHHHFPDPVVTSIISVITTFVLTATLILSASAFTSASTSPPPLAPLRPRPLPPRRPTIPNPSHQTPFPIPVLKS